jgi:hypothetical protein
LEENKSTWLKNEEIDWKHKSRVLWLKEGDNNTKFFHHYANQRRNINSIWEIKNEEDVLVSSFQDKSEARARYFENLFAAPEGCPIQETLDVVSKFPSVISLETNRDLCEEVTELELSQALNSMQSGKSPGPWMVLQWSFSSLSMSS